LEQIGKRPSLLVLMEWSYSRGPYEGPTLFVYNEGSFTADIFASGKRRIGWRKGFPRRRVVAVPGDHDSSFTDANAPHLVEAVSRHSRPQNSGRSLWSRLTRRGSAVLGA
jgi:hypothetical protein